jgi:acyl-lipid omega-6 desaturase (Delta-12 desaturase)
MGDVDTLTVREYLALSRRRRLGYRLYRHPVVMFGFGPAYLFIMRHRLPFGFMRSGWQPWLSTMATNAAIAFLVAMMMSLVGVGPFLRVHLPITLLAASIGVRLFYVQHQFEHTFWAQDRSWNLHEAALHGSSHYDLPGVLRWCSHVPYYRVNQVLRDHPELGAIGRLTLSAAARRDLPIPSSPEISTTCPSPCSILHVLDVALTRSDARWGHAEEPRPKQ